LGYEPFYPDLPLPGPEPAEVDDEELAYCRNKRWIQIRRRHVRYGYEVRPNVFEPCIVIEMTLTRLARIELYEQSVKPSEKPRTAEVGSVEQPTETEPPPPPPQRWAVDLACMTIMLDGETYEVSSKQALRWVKVLFNHPNEWISAPAMKTYDEELYGVRPDRKCKPYLPNEILSLIDTDRRKGSRLRLP